MHLGELELGLGADTRSEGGVADDVSEGLPIVGVSVAIHAVLPIRLDSSIAREGSRHRWFEGRRSPYLSVSYSAKTLRFVWSRIVCVPTNPPRSSAFALNIDIVAVVIRVVDAANR